MPPHFRTFCELVEGEENKLTTFSTWTIMLGCNESNIISQQHLRKLGQLRRSNGKIHKYSVKKRPTGHYKKYSHFKGRDTHCTYYYTSSRGDEKFMCACARRQTHLARGLFPAGDAPLCAPHLYRKVFILGYTQ